MRSRRFDAETGDEGDDQRIAFQSSNIQPLSRPPFRRRRHRWRCVVGALRKRGLINRNLWKTRGRFLFRFTGGSINGSG